jgi:hypothetical protein
VTVLRRLILRHRPAAAWLVAFALLMRLLVPTGYMPSMANGRIGIELCPGTAPVKLQATAHGSMPGITHHEEEGGHEQPEQPCAYAGLSAPTLGGTDPLLLTAALAYVAAVALRVAPPPASAQPHHLRPPLRGPPTLA